MNKVSQQSGIAPIKLEVQNVVIIGSGPAGYTAGIYTGRALLNPLLFEGDQPGGQLTTTTDVENYPGFESINGFELVDNMRNQAVKCGCNIINETVINVDLSNMPYKITTDNSVYLTKSIIIATGASANKLNIPGNNELWQKGISACAVCDGALPMFRNKTLIVVGGGDTAMEEAMFLSRYASEVIIVHRRDTFRASKTMQDRVLNNEKIKVIWNSEVVKANGNNSLESVDIMDVVSKEIQTIQCAGLFYAIGHTPNTKFLNNQLELDENGYIKLKDGFKTSVSNVFACGDVHDKKYRQAITAAGFGCAAALEVVKLFE